jgi:hypothetical protein
VAREYLFFVLGLLVVGALAFAGSFVAWLRRAPRSDDANTPASILEADAARGLLRPLLPAALGCALLVGWFVVEPPIGEKLPWQALALAVAPGVVALRALIRALSALFARHHGPAVTVGFLRRRIVLDPAFVAGLSDDEREAVIAHERAHVEHNDPLRLFAAQLLTDLQWPMPGARERLYRFREALELARDEEARDRVDGAALATAVLCAARSASGGAERYATAAIVNNGAVLRARIERLLAPVPRRIEHSALRPLRLALIGGALASSFFVGVYIGEDMVQAAFGQRR